MAAFSASKAAFFSSAALSFAAFSASRLFAAAIAESFQDFALTNGKVTEKLASFSKTGFLSLFNAKPAVHSNLRSGPWRPESLKTRTSFNNVEAVSTTNDVSPKENSLAAKATVHLPVFSSYFWK